MSQVTLIEAINIVLEAIGERRVNAITSPVARKANQAIQEALVNISTSNDWDWLKQSVLAISWVNDLAYLGEVQKVYSVSVGDTTNGFRILPWVDRTTYDSFPVFAIPTTDRYPYSRCYTQPTYGYCKVNAYPVSAEHQALYRFEVLKDITTPLALTETFNIPTRFMPLVYYRASYTMAMNHLDDGDSAQLFARQYDDLAIKLRDRERDIPQASANMFRLRRYR